MISLAKVRMFLLELLVPIALVFVWWAVSRHSTNPYFPSLSKIWTDFKHVYIWKDFNSDVLYSLGHFAVGVPIGIVIGFAIGLLLGLSPRLRHDVAPITEFCRATPAVALIPIGLIIFGPGLTLEAFLIALGCVWAVMLNTADGIRRVDPVMIDTACSYGLSPAQLIRKILIPAAMPQVLSGVRIAVGLGVNVMVLANMFANSQGLGALVVQAQSNFDIVGSWAGIIMIAIIGIVITAIYAVIHAQLLRWHTGWRAAAGSN